VASGIARPASEPPPVAPPSTPPLGAPPPRPPSLELENEARTDVADVSGLNLKDVPTAEADLIEESQAGVQIAMDSVPPGSLAVPAGIPMGASEAQTAAESSVTDASATAPVSLPPIVTADVAAPRSVDPPPTVEIKQRLEPAEGAPSEPPEATQPLSRRSDPDAPIEGGAIADSPIPAEPIAASAAEEETELEREFRERSERGSRPPHEGDGSTETIAPEGESKRGVWGWLKKAFGGKPG
jgi:hypothetical protein